MSDYQLPTEPTTVADFQYINAVRNLARNGDRLAAAAVKQHDRARAKNREAAREQRRSDLRTKRGSGTVADVMKKQRDARPDDTA